MQVVEALGATRLHMALHHILPGLTPALIVLFTLNIGHIILLESALSFFGIGVQQPTPSWGNMIDEGRQRLA